jgi:hypothetical protein
MGSALRVNTNVLPGHKIEVDASELTVGDHVEVTVVPANEPPGHHHGAGSAGQPARAPFVPSAG